MSTSAVAFKELLQVRNARWLLHPHAHYLCCFSPFSSPSTSSHACLCALYMPVPAASAQLLCGTPPARLAVVDQHLFPDRDRVLTEHAPGRRAIGTSRPLSQLSTSSCADTPSPCIHGTALHTLATARLRRQAGGDARENTARAWRTPDRPARREHVLLSHKRVRTDTDQAFVHTHLEIYL
jgi:hypothetical protein